MQKFNAFVIVKYINGQRSYWNGHSWYPNSDEALVLRTAQAAQELVALFGGKIVRLWKVL